MKVSYFLVTAIFTFAAGFTFAAADDFKKFDEADIDGDGVLSIQEAQMALPGLRLDAPATAGSMLTRQRVQQAVPGLTFEDDSAGPVTEEEYEKIVEHMRERGMTSSPASTSPGQTGQSSSPRTTTSPSTPPATSPRTTTPGTSSPTTPR
jgi:hypothetical protein